MAPVRAAYRAAQLDVDIGVKRPGQMSRDVLRAPKIAVSADGRMPRIDDRPVGIADMRREVASFDERCEHRMRLRGAAANLLPLSCPG